MTGPQSDLDEGFLQVEFRDGSGRPLAGFTRDDCPPLWGDRSNLLVQWNGGAADLPEARSARSYLKRAFLYGFD